jgi:hypothetical protein
MIVQERLNLRVQRSLDSQARVNTHAGYLANHRSSRLARYEAGASGKAIVLLS